MSTQAFKLIEVYNDLVNEIGDLDNISQLKLTPTSLSTYQGNFDYNGKNYTLNVRLEPIDNLKKDIQFPPHINYEKANMIINLGFDVDGMNKQAVKTKKTLFSILKSVLDVAIDYINKNPKDMLLLLPEKKDKRGINGSDEDIKQKMNLYRVIAKKNLPSTHSFDNIKIANELDGLVIYPKNL